MPRSQAQTEEEWIPVEEDPAGETIEGESGLEIITDALTPMYSWPPILHPDFQYFYEFKTAAACHDYNSSGSRDVYGIAAVFQMKSGTTYWDRLYYLRVEGHSTYPDYGQLLTSTHVDSSSSSSDGSKQIYAVDCTSDGNGSVFIVWDKTDNNARWARFYGTTKYGPYIIEGGYGQGGDYFSSRKPRIAYGKHPTYPYVMVVYSGYFYAVGRWPSTLLMRTFVASTGQVIDDEFWWPDGGNRPVAWDVEWNGSNRFIVAYFPRADQDYPLKLRTARVDYQCNMEADYEIQNWGYPPVPPPPVPDLEHYDMKLVYTDGNKNTDHRFVLQTSDGVTYWLNQAGDKYIDDYEDYWQYNPRYQYGGNYSDYFDVCEYWGNISNRIAHTFGWNFVYYPGPPPYVLMNTRHMHWDMRPTSGDPYEISGLNNGYFPAACNAGDTLINPELLLVSRAAAGSKYVFWNMESQ